MVNAKKYRRTLKIRVKRDILIVEYQHVLDVKTDSFGIKNQNNVYHAPVSCVKKDVLNTQQ